LTLCGLIEATRLSRSVAWKHINVNFESLKNWTRHLLLASLKHWLVGNRFFLFLHYEIIEHVIQYLEYFAVLEVILRISDEKIPLPTTVFFHEFVSLLLIHPWS
jgi:hypothetical protein